MADPIEALFDAIERDEGGVAVVWSPMDAGIRDWLASQVESLAPERDPVRVRSVADALSHRTRLALLLPVDELDAVLDLDGCRDKILNEAEPRTQPIILFLFRDGEGQKAISNAASLAGWVRGSTPDPEAIAEVDVAVERARFKARTGKTPAAWLSSWRKGTTHRTAENYALASQAMFLEHR